MAKVFFYTQGCANNQTDSETMAGILEEDGYEVVESPNNADCLVINTCTVKNATETQFFRALKQFKKKPTVIAGCIAQTDKEKLHGYSLIGTTNLHHISEVVEETLNGNQVIFTKRENSERLNLPKIRQNSFVEIIPINRGCLGNCTYCKTKAARFNLQSFNKDAILKQAENAIKEGVKIIHLTSQDTAVYGQDLAETESEKNIQLPVLLKELCSLEGNFKIKLGMGNPDHYIKMLPQLIEAFKHEKMFKKAIPEMQIMTDIICGFPTESDEQFEDTIRLIEETRPDSLNISRYSARPKTLAASWKQLPTHKSAERSRKLAYVFEKIAEENSRQWKDKVFNVIIDEEGRQGTNTINGRNESCRQIVVKNPDNEIKLGDIIKVRIIETHKY